MGLVAVAVERALGESKIRNQVSDAIRAGEVLRSSPDGLAVLRPAYATWNKRNELFLERAFKKSGFLDSTPKDQYVSALGLEYPFGLEAVENLTLDGLQKDISTKLDRLRQVLETLDVYEGPDEPTAKAPDSAGESTIFVVHGRASSPRLEVEKLISRATTLDPIILAEQVGGGAVTLIEKLENHLGKDVGTAFAVVVMTADDEGRLAEPTEDLQPRARQNVVLELGYAMAALGRRKVAILHESGIELPSDISGVAYYLLDEGGAWKSSILGELKAAGIQVDSDALLPE